MFNLTRHWKRRELRMRKVEKMMRADGFKRRDFRINSEYILVAFNILSILHSSLSLGCETVNKIHSLPRG